MGDNVAGADAGSVALPVVVVWVFAPGEDILAAQVVWPLEQNPGPILHTQRAAATQVATQLWTVTAALVIVTLEVLLLVKDDLATKNEDTVVAVYQGHQTQTQVVGHFVITFSRVVSFPHWAVMTAKPNKC